MNRSSASRVVSVLGGVGLAAILLVWVFYNTDREQVWQAIRGVSIPLLVLAPFCNLIQNFFRSWRWRALLEPVRKGISFWPLFYAIVMGYAANVVVPGRLGEVVRPAVLSRKEDLPVGATMGSMLSDRLLDLLSAALLLALGMSLLDPGVGSEVDSFFLVLGLVVTIVAIPAAVLLLVHRFRASIVPWVESRGLVLKKFGRLILSFSSGVEAIGDLRLLPRLVGQSAIMWMLIVLGTWFGLKACAISLTLPQVMVLLPLLIVGFALPTPGGAGGYHAGMTFGLVGLFGVGKSEAAAASLVIHLAITVGALVVGGVSLGLDRSGLFSSSSRVAGPGQSRSE